MTSQVNSENSHNVLESNWRIPTIIVAAILSPIAFAVLRFLLWLMRQDKEMNYDITEGPRNEGSEFVFNKTPIIMSVLGIVSILGAIPFLWIDWLYPAPSALLVATYLLCATGITITVWLESTLTQPRKIDPNAATGSC